MKKLLLLILGKSQVTPTPDVLDVLFDQPRLALRQAHWKVNGRRMILNWILRLAFLLGVVWFLTWSGG